ncbi:hypothetical protein [Puniceibacterium sp. IMCC21224]|uniref:hypothetical protein n=1 Tax=Puniceibacterium sp. IMCC21224 TaxID=1618204 RepID=UPI00064D7E64|nr:hypothetical protein [Puniceibacterium sp. IMCC21224]KMK66619.1 hypothetical protein IMCC21224_111471 [Puniceibacterium sp. IMCC21224]
MATAFVEPHAHAEAPNRGNVIGEIFKTIGRGLVRIAESNRKIQEVERLQAMSDEQLANRGLKRDEIVHYVFRDMFYL